MTDTSLHIAPGLPGVFASGTPGKPGAIWISLLALLLVPTLVPAQGVPGLRVPAGFVVTEWADASVANDIYSIAFTNDGRLVVAGRGYLKLVEGTEDDKAGKATDFAHPLADGAMGLLWDDGHLYATGGGGLRRFRDVDKGGREKPSEVLFACKTGGEHDAHAVVRGPDGWFYLLCGNSTGIAAKHATLPTSPIKEPTAGVLLRFPPDFAGCEVVADGFRNAYGLDHNAAGEWFTYDSDNERCVGLPWYEPTRAYHVVPGGRYGWKSPQKAQTWRMPPHFLDVVPPLAHLDRGSPTGVVCYRDAQFPREYRDGLFLLDWTFGRIWFLKLTPDGAGYRTEPVRFLETTGEAGFAPTSAAVHPKSGDLFVAIGGRGTRGAICRIRHPEGLKKLQAERAFRKFTPPRSPDWKPDQARDWLRQATDADLQLRRRGLELLTRHDAMFRTDDLVAVLRENLRCDDRLVRQATARLIAKLPADAQAKVAAGVAEPGSRVTLALAGLADGPLLDLALDDRLASHYAVWGLRLTQRWLGDVPAKSPGGGTAFEGYTLAGKGDTLTVEQRAALARLLPAKHADVTREAARVLAIVADDRPEALEAVLDCLRRSPNAADDLHYLLCVARLPAPRTEPQTALVAGRLLGLDAIQERDGQVTDTHWPLRLAELHKELAARDPALNAALLKSPDFGRAAHAVFTRAPGFDRVAAARRFLDRRKQPGFAWNADLVGLLARLPAEEARPVARELWGEVGLDDALLPLLTREPLAEDRVRFVEGLALGQPALVQKAAAALEKLGPSRDADETFALLKALRDVPPEKDHDAVRAQVVAVLQTQTKEKRTTFPEWAAWLRTTDADRAKRLEQGIDRAAWAERLGKVAWDRGDAERGKAVYAKASCAACHSGAQALGPDLRGVAGRFSRDDLFVSLIDPNKDVPARYRMTAFTTEAGKVYQGVVIYEATDSLILQTGPGTTVRIDSPKIRERRLVPQSLMPAGLLDRLRDDELADLYAYLRGLK